VIEDSRERYGKVSMAFHWVMAGLIGWQLLKLGDRIAEGEHWIGQTLVPWHVSVGTLLLGLIVLRLLWVASQRRQRPAHDPATAWLVKGGHGLLFVGMLAMPVTGVLTMVGGGHGLTAFGIELIAKGEKVAWAGAVGGLHSPIAWALTALVIGHIGMALFHHFVRRDDTLRRII
jgi:cytochrome b561